MKASLFRDGRWPKVAALVVAILASGCGAKTVLVQVPPRIDLRAYDAIGVVDFAPDSADRLGKTATQQFMSAIYASQPGVRFLELGPVERLLGEAHRERIDPDTVKLFGARYKVDSVFSGSYGVSESLTQVSVGNDIWSMRALDE